MVVDPGDPAADDVAIPFRRLHMVADGNREMQHAGGVDGEIAGASFCQGDVPFVFFCHLLPPLCVIRMPRANHMMVFSGVNPAGGR